MPENRLIDPPALARISRLELVARQAVEGFLSGKHPSPYFGSSVEYADHRPYTISDELRSIDWKLLAKTDKYFIKLFEEQTNLRATVVLDASRSMGFTSGKITKLEYGCHLAAALSYLLLRQNDAVGMALFDGSIRHYVPARSTASHFRMMVDLLEGLKPSSETHLGPILHELAGRLKRRGLVILISDLLDDVDKTIDGIAHFRHKKHEVIVFHVIDEAELSFPYERLTRFKDLEGAGSFVANPQMVRKRYLERLQEFLTRVKGGCLERDVSYVLARTDTPYEQLISSFLEKRGRFRS